MKWLLVLALLASGCLFDDLSYEGMSCPCPDGWSCDPLTDRCTSDSSSGGSCTPLLPVTGFGVEWRTPNAIRWSWDPPSLDLQSSFVAYELVVGEDEQAVATADESRGARIFTAAQNPELGVFTYKHIEDVYLVQSTATDGLEPSTFYHGMLVVKDKGGCAFRSQVVQAPLSVTEGDSIELFIDGLTAPATDTPGLVVTTDCGAGPDGSPGTGDCLRCETAVCTAGPNGGTEGGEVLKVNLTPSANPFGGEPQFEGAYLELKVAWDAPHASYYTNVWIRSPDGLVEYQTLSMSWGSGGAYRTYQVPLSAMVSGGQGMTFADTMAGFNQIALWAEWAGSTFVYVDDVAIRW